MRFHDVDGWLDFGDIGGRFVGDVGDIGGGFVGGEGSFGKIILQLMSMKGCLCFTQFDQWFNKEK